MSAFVITQLTAAAGAAAFGLLALPLSLLVRADNRGLGGFCADFAGVVGVGALFLLSCHLFASGETNFYCAVCFAAGLTVARLVFARVKPRLAVVFSPVVRAVTERRERNLALRRRRFAEREDARIATREKREKENAAAREKRLIEKAAARKRREREKAAARAEREKEKSAERARRETAERRAADGKRPEKEKAAKARRRKADVALGRGKGEGAREARR